MSYQGRNSQALMPHSLRFQADYTAPDHSGEGNSFGRSVLVQRGNAMSLLALKSGIFQTMTQGRNISYQTVDKTANLIYRSRRGILTLEINSSALFLPLQMKTADWFRKSHLGKCHARSLPGKITCESLFEEAGRV
jgi:hypothetical protein